MTLLFDVWMGVLKKREWWRKKGDVFMRRKKNIGIKQPTENRLLRTCMCNAICSFGLQKQRPASNVHILLKWVHIHTYSLYYTIIAILLFLTMLHCNEFNNSIWIYSIVDFIFSFMYFNVRNFFSELYNFKIDVWRLF